MPLTAQRGRAITVLGRLDNLLFGGQDDLSIKLTTRVYLLSNVQSFGGPESNIVRSAG